MSVQIQLRHDTAANWTSANPTMAAGECGVETDTHKFKTGDGATAWNSLAYVGTATTPGGSTTQIQFNNAGAFGGDANLVWSAFDGMLSAQTTGGGGTNYAFEARLSNGQPCLRVGQTATNASFVSFGDVYQNGNVTYFQLGDAGKTIDFSAPGGLIQLGDPAYIVNGSLVAIDDLNQKTTSNVKHEASGDITIMDSAKGLVLKDTAGTPHYWRISVSTAGVLSTADLGTSPP